jgi:hypothetical protein
MTSLLMFVRFFQSAKQYWTGWPVGSSFEGTALAMPRSSIPTINEVIATRSALRSRAGRINRSPPLREPAAESIRDSPQYVVVTADECVALIGRQGDRIH